MKQLQRLLREPLLHFFAIGGLIFLFYGAVSDTGKAPADVIVITSERIDQLAVRFTSVWKRQPTEKELDTLIKELPGFKVLEKDRVMLGASQVYGVRVVPVI